jgi:hypothetical protein
MKSTFAGSMIVFVGLAATTWAGPEKPFPTAKYQVKVKSSWTMTVKFKGGERANVIIVGEKEKSYLALYIYDENGNLIARDDDTKGFFLNDRWVIWFPAKTQKYTIEVRNLGTIEDDFFIAIR